MLNLKISYKILVFGNQVTEKMFSAGNKNNIQEKGKNTAVLSSQAGANVIKRLTSVNYECSL